MLSTNRSAAASARTRYRVRMARTGAASRLTHLAQIESLRRAVLESGLPALSDGKRKRPRPRISFGPAIAMGYESAAEYFDLELESRVPPEEVKEALGNALPAGMTLRGVRRIPRFFPSIDASVNVVRYALSGSFPGDAARRLEDFLRRDAIVVEKIKKGGERIERVDVRPLIVEMTLAAPDRLELTMRFGPKRTVKPEAVVGQWLGNVPGNLHVLREELFSETAGGELILP